ncbi:E3 ubiquitin/ISG15 ligase TRIM25 isoform X2 [Pseudorasbora parva]|uniref:E3 ubiquitin/ISG15 ligase TRIM25 isoform X2 n=1 Tax=Pseudorasbora parva TaxID=51549 RepID=UPI00351F7748
MAEHLTAPKCRYCRYGRRRSIDLPPSQLCTSGLLSEELQCSICLDVFTDPVTTPCGHNFCKTCLEKSWDNSQVCTCPYCRESFNACPALKCNTTLREIVKLFEKNTGYKRDPITEYPRPLKTDIQDETLYQPLKMAFSNSVLTENLQCFICLEPSTDPVKTPCGHIFCKACLKECWESSHDNRCPCCKESFNKRADLRYYEQLWSQSEILMHQSSYREPEVKPPGRALNIKPVMMLDLVENINPYIIQKYDRSLELLCRDNHTSVCMSSAEEDHKTHNIVPAEDESEKKAQNMMLKLERNIQDTIKKNKEIKCFKMIINKKNKENEKANIELCTDPNYSTERCQMAFPELWAKTRMEFLLLLLSSRIYKVDTLQKG